MKHFNKILCPYDFSSHSDEALRFAIKLADPSTTITLFHVIELPYLTDPNGFTYYDHKAEEIKLDAEKGMNKELVSLNDSYPQIHFDYKIQTNDDPAAAILKIQKEEDFDLIVIGSHGRKGLSRLLMGSVAESVMREATSPVLIFKNN